MPVREVLEGADEGELERLFTTHPQFFAGDASSIELTQNIFVVRSPELTVLMDTGQPLRQAGDILRWGLGAVGLLPEQVDLVFLSHRDDDHVGGTVGLDGQPLFPKALYLMAKREYDDFKAEARRAKPFVESIGPLEKRGVLELFDGEAEIARGLTAVPTPGHRLDATSLRVEDGSQAALLLADTMHLTVQATHPEWSSVWDSDKALAAQTRRHVLEQAEQEGLLLGIPHTPLGGLGYVREQRDTLVWSPLF
jgi:glyoxylase-like metal-dependent hydrolase (beta-lactamase superfamily II)